MSGRVVCRVGSVAAVTLVLCCVSALSPAADLTRPVIMGAGFRSCGKWKLGTHDEQSEMQSWLGGFLSGLNTRGSVGHPDFLKTTDPDAIFAWMDKYCAEHPLAKLANAAVVLWAELEPRATEKKAH